MARHVFNSRQVAPPKQASFVTGQGYPLAAASDVAATPVALRAPSVAATSQPLPPTAVLLRGVRCTCAFPNKIGGLLDKGGNVGYVCLENEVEAAHAGRLSACMGGEREGLSTKRSQLSHWGVPNAECGMLCRPSR